MCTDSNKSRDIIQGRHLLSSASITSGHYLRAATIKGVVFNQVNTVYDWMLRNPMRIGIRHIRQGIGQAKCVNTHFWHVGMYVSYQILQYLSTNFIVPILMLP